jgi:hypothetical protein
VDDGALSPAAWLRHRARMSPGEAKATVRTARALADGRLDATSAALAAGEVDAAHARLIARHTADAPDGAVALIEPEALKVARAADPSVVAGVMRQFGHALDPDRADEAAVRRYDRRGVSVATTLDGMVAGTLLLDPVAGATVLTALSAASPLVAGDGPAPRSATPMPWRRSARGDADVTVVAVGGSEGVREVGRTRRFFSTAQRIAIMARDGDRCAAPYCDRPAIWSDAHHVVPWAQRGKTDIDNGALPCAAHHTNAA